MGLNSLMVFGVFCILDVHALVVVTPYPALIYHGANPRVPVLSVTAEDTDTKQPLINVALTTSDDAEYFQLIQQPRVPTEWILKVEQTIDKPVGYVFMFSVYGYCNQAPQTQRIQINVTEKNEHAPSFESQEYTFFAYRNGVDYNLIDIGIVNAVDTDLELYNRHFRYHILDPIAEHYFHVDLESGLIKMIANIPVNVTSVSFSVTAIDGGSPQRLNSTDVSILITDLRPSLLGKSICWDSKWFNASVSVNGSNYEHKPADVSDRICTYGSIIAADCRDDKGETFRGTINDTYFVAVCNPVDGLVCQPNPHFPFSVCPNFSIRYGCQCLPITTTVKSPLRLEDAIDVKCTDSNWNISVNMNRLKMMYPSVRPTDIFFGSDKCQGHLDTSYLLFTQSFNYCSTTEKFYEDMNIYKNNLYYIVFDPARPYVVLKHEWTFIVECDVNTNEVTSSHVEHIPEIHNASFSSHYHLSMAYFSDVNFIHRISGNPLIVTLGENIFVKVFTTLADWDTKMVLDTCYTRPSSRNTTTMDVTLIKDGCEVDRNTNIISQSTHETRFVYKDFKYFNNNGGLDLYCNATFCHSSDFSARCTQVCSHT